MTEKRFIILLFCVIGLLLTSPVSAKMVTAKVDDKGFIFGGIYGVDGTLHTPYGWIIVENNDYYNIQVNDTIRYDIDTDFFWNHYWEVEKVS